MVRLMARPLPFVLSAALGVLLSTSIAAPTPAAACDCGQGEPTVAEARARLATIIEGRVVTIAPGAAGHDVTLFVLRAWKGATAGTTITIAIDASSCGYAFVPGDEVLIYAPAGAPVEQCRGDQTARVRLGAGIAADAAALGPPSSSAPLPAPVATAPAADIEIEGKVLVAPGGDRHLMTVEVTRGRRGARKHERLTVVSPVGACAATTGALAVGDRVTVTGRRVAALGPSTAVISGCDPATRVRVTRSARHVR